MDKHIPIKKLVYEELEQQELTTNQLLEKIAQKLEDKYGEDSDKLERHLASIGCETTIKLRNAIEYYHIQHALSSVH